VESVVLGCGKGNLLIVLGDFSAVTGSSRLLGGDSILGAVVSPTRFQIFSYPSAEVSGSVLLAPGSGGRTSTTFPGY